MAQKDAEYRTVLNQSLVNTCDGSSIALMAGWIHKEKFQALNGPEIFTSYIEKPYKQLLLGSTEIVLENIKQKLESKGVNTANLYSISLPFNTVEVFDYDEIAKQVNLIDPDIIWVSLGAPKQELFMSKLHSHINRGIMFGIGAAFNFYIGNLTIPQIRIGRLSLIWLSRLIKEPKKLSIRLFFYIISLPGLYWNERKNVKNIKRENLS